jgi:hypothetical protein
MQFFNFWGNLWTLSDQILYCKVEFLAVLCGRRLKFDHFRSV